MFQCGVNNVSLDYAIFGEAGLVAASYFDRSQMALRSVSASLATDAIKVENRTFSTTRENYTTFISPVVYGKEKFFHAISVIEGINKNVFISTEEKAADDYYNYLMANFNLPLMQSWAEELLKESLRRRVLSMAKSVVYMGKNSITACVSGVDIHTLRAYTCNLSEENLKDMVTGLFSAKKICISKNRQNKLEFTNMDQYFSNYGHTLVENLEKQIKPLHELSGNVDSLVLNNMRLFPQQAAQLNGIVELLENSNYGILNMGMGTGKTITSASMTEGYFVNKYIKSHPGETLRDVYSAPGKIRYRNIVMCPGHLVQKWAAEIKREVPYAKVTVISDLSQLVDIKSLGKGRTEKEWFIIGKDFAKLSYMSVPVPKKVKQREIKVRYCAKCKTAEKKSTGDSFVCECGSKEFRVVGTGLKGTGLACPECGEILMPNIGLNDEDEDFIDLPLSPSDFSSPNSKNAKCHLCGCELWKPHVRNVFIQKSEFEPWVKRGNVWQRVSHYANKAHKAIKSVWVHRDFKDDYFTSISEEPLNEKSLDDGGTRRFAPATFIKKQLKGYFDFFILDEAHLFKGGATAQGNAMHALVKASRKQLALTGTIAGGMATHLFYLLFRLDPRRMKKYGYKFESEMEFARTYGTLETMYQVDDEDRSYNRNQTSRGRQLGSPKVKPGISPLIFRDFLLDKTVFLDLSDMSKYLPKLIEKVVRVEVAPTVETEDGNIESNPELQMLYEYKSVIQCLKEKSRQKDGGGLGVLSKMLQFSLSYPDHPYDVSPILSSHDGSIICKPKNFHFFADTGKLLSKEKKLVEIAKQEISEGRNFVIYVEFTGSPETCVTHRLKEILERECKLDNNEVVIIESSSPAASKREEWMHQKAAEGAKIFIVHPRCVETGLDFCWKGQDGVLYNYPTLIFYQLGYSLFTVWQASRRSFRLNQREECRTYYLAYAGTVQEAVIQVIAEKQVATSAIQGKFSTEGLSAMAQGVDVKVKLAQAMSNMDSINGSGLQDMFDVLNAEDSTSTQYDGYQPMMTFEELVGKRADSIIADALGDKLFSDMLNKESYFDSFTFDNFLATEGIDIPGNDESNISTDQDNCIEKKVSVESFDVQSWEKEFEKLNVDDNGQISLRSLFG